MKHDIGSRPLAACMLDSRLGRRVRKANEGVAPLIIVLSFYAAAVLVGGWASVILGLTGSLVLGMANVIALDAPAVEIGEPSGS